jgi:hypothetical protein
MSRSESLEHRVRELTDEFGRLLRAEFMSVAAGGTSRFLTRKVPHVMDGRYWSTVTSDRLERLESEMRRSPGHLADPESAELLRILDTYTRGRESASDRHEGGEIRLARQALVAMGDRWHAT